MEKIAIVDFRADNETVSNIENIGLKVIPTVKIENLYDAVATHADMQIHYLGNNKFITAPESFEHYKKYMPSDIILIRGSMGIGSEFPYDIRYNATSLGEFLICKIDYTAEEILKEYIKQNKKVLNVKQGYSKCNCCVVNDNSIITSDSGIAEIAIQNGIDVLKIEQGNIKLRGFEYGFIGGATGLINDSLLVFNGDLHSHPNYKEIKKFCKMRGVDILSLKSGALVDIGTIITNYK